MKVSKRVAWVDYAKGLAIIGVFVLHSNAPEYVIHVVDMFCMPAFFLLSGFVFSIRKYGSFRPFLWNKLRTLVFPGLFFVIVPFAVERLVGTILGDAWSLNAYVKWLAGYIINMRGHEGYGNVPWFLACLFLVEIGGYVLLRLSERLWDSEWVFMVFGAISIFIGYAYSKFIHIVLPWGGDVALSMFGFFIFWLCVARISGSDGACSASCHYHSCGSAVDCYGFAEYTAACQRIYEPVRESRVLPCRGVLRSVVVAIDLHRAFATAEGLDPVADNQLLGPEHVGVLLCECFHLRRSNSFDTWSIRHRNRGRIHR